MTPLEIVFVASFFLGLAYAIISTIMGGVFGGGHEGTMDSGGIDVQHDISGHVDMNAEADHGTVHFSPLSPVVLAMFVTAFGGAGMVCLKVFKLSPYFSTAIAVAIGIAVGAATFALFAWLFSITQGSSEAILSSMVGQEAEVITTIPAVGLGEIAYVAKGTRYNAPARSANGTEIKSHSNVIIEKISGNTFVVKPTEVIKTV